MNLRADEHGNCCGLTHEDCPLYEADPTQPCWGLMVLADYPLEGEVHACEGHADQMDGSGPYKPMPFRRSSDRSPSRPRERK